MNIPKFGYGKYSDSIDNVCGAIWELEAHLYLERCGVSDEYFVSKNGFYLWNCKLHNVERVRNVLTYNTMRVCKEVYTKIVSKQEGPDKTLVKFLDLLKDLKKHEQDMYNQGVKGGIS